MSDNKREQERTELYRTIWALANELRGSVDGCAYILSYILHYILHKNRKCHFWIIFLQ